MGRHRKSLIVGFVFLWSFSLKSNAQQNIQFSQYMFNSLSVNPAYAGYKEEWFVQMGLRTQWTGVEGAPQTGTISLDGILDPRDRRMGVGMQITTDRTGAQSSTNATLNYAYRLQLDPDDNQRLSFGIGAGFLQSTLRGDLLHPIDENDQSLPIGRERSLVPDFRLGAYYNSNFFYLGVSMLDALSDGKDPSPGSASANLDIRRSRHLYFIAGGLVNLSSRVRLRPGVLLKDDFRGPMNADLNLMCLFDDKIWLGGSYRTSLGGLNKEFQNVGTPNSMTGIVQFFVTERFKVGYSYDYVTSHLGNNLNGSHELTLGLTFGKVPRSFICPRVF